jgi:hypothetical protein
VASHLFDHENFLPHSLLSGLLQCIPYTQPVRFAGLLWLKVLFADLLREKNTAGWLLVPLNQRIEH